MGDINAFAFLSIVEYQFGILCKIWGSTFSRNWRRLKTWDQFHVIRRVYKGGLTHLLLFLSSNISLEFYAKFEGQRFLETGDISRPGTNFMSLGGSQGWPNAFAFLSIVKYQFGIFWKIWGSTFSRKWRCLKTWDQFHVSCTSLFLPESKGTAHLLKVCVEGGYKSGK